MSNEMVTDRTFGDVKKAKTIRNRGVPFTADEVEILERGTLTINTINRIERKQAEIRQALNEWGYYNNSGENKGDWTYSDYFLDSDFSRVCSNNAKLRASFWVHSDTPENALSKYDFEEINKLEKILANLEAVVSSLRCYECNTFYSGEEIK